MPAINRPAMNPSIMPAGLSRQPPSRPRNSTWPQKLKNSKATSRATSTLTRKKLIGSATSRSASLASGWSPKSGAMTRAKGA